MAIKFGAIRKYCSRIDRVSICMYETSQYENYELITQVPHEFDELYLYGFGGIKSEFPAKEGWGHLELYCIEIVLSKEPRTDL